MPISDFEYAKDNKFEISLYNLIQLAVKSINNLWV